jgi:hypothetical protein
MTIEPKTWEGTVKLQETKTGSGVFTIKPHSQGKYSADDAGAILKAMLGAPKGTKFDGWKFWLEGDFSMELEKGADVTQAMIAKIAKEADNVILAYVKRPFPQPKLKFTKGEPKPQASRAKSTLREL